MQGKLLLLECTGLLLGLGCAGISTSNNVAPTNSPLSSNHSVDLSWVASTSADVSGYNVYRADYAGACGAFSKINPALVTTTSYRDATVTNGAAYCFATTAVSSNSQESGYSNIVSGLAIPTT